MENKLRALMIEAEDLQSTNSDNAEYYGGVYDGLWAAVQVTCLNQEIGSIKAEGQLPGTQRRNRIEKLEKQYSAANASYISARMGIEEALAMIGNTANPNHIKRTEEILRKALDEIKTLRKDS